MGFVHFQMPLQCIKTFLDEGQGKQRVGRHVVISWLDYILCLQRSFPLQFVRLGHYFMDPPDFQPAWQDIFFLILMRTWWNISALLLLILRLEIGEAWMAFVPAALPLLSSICSHLAVDRAYLATCIWTLTVTKLDPSVWSLGSLNDTEINPGPVTWVQFDTGGVW